MTTPTRLTLGNALTELERRNNQLTTEGRLEAGDDMPTIEAVTHFTALEEQDIRDAAERIARYGRTAKVALTILVPDDGYPHLAWFGGSALLREAAELGRTVRLENDR